MLVLVHTKTIVVLLPKRTALARLSYFLRLIQLDGYVSVAVRWSKFRSELQDLLPSSTSPKIGSAKNLAARDAHMQPRTCSHARVHVSMCGKILTLKSITRSFLQQSKRFWIIG
jgi:hypothetical protein